MKKSLRIMRRIEFVPRWGFCMEYARFEEHDSLILQIIWGKVYLPLPWGGDPKDCMMDRWGFSFFERSLHLSWRDKTKIIWLPWDFAWVRTDIWAADGKKFDGKTVQALYGKDRLDFLQAPTVPYLYVRKSGEVQERTARYYVEEMEWRWRWLKFLAFPRKIIRSIRVEFSDEVGEGTGSWKGGTVGCGYDLKPGESPLDCLRRMERERKFVK